MDINLIVLLGPTASGKTKLAARLAKDLGAEIISADSRQVYRGMDRGTGKDLDDYWVAGTLIPYHLIDIVDPAYEFSVFDYQQRFFQCFTEIRSRNILPLLVGGSGLYIDAVLRGYRMHKVPEDRILRATLEKEDSSLLVKHLLELSPALHNTTDTLDRQRLIRAIEIARHSREQGGEDFAFPALHPLVVGIRWDRTCLRQRITERLAQRLAEGMLEEVKGLHEQGISWEKLDSFGLEYRYLGFYLQGKLGYQEMFQQLNTRIHQFAKRQETWFRRMERLGTEIHWLANPDYEELRALVERELA